MTSPISIAVFLMFVLGSACKTIPNKQAQNQAAAATPAAVTGDAEEPKPVEPSPAMRTTPDLVTPGQDEVLIRRGPGTRCPTQVEMDTVERTVGSLGKETIDLVKEDLASLRQTSTRSDRDGIASCCNQMEQLVQDAEIMNEDKDSAVTALDRIRRLTLTLCPPGP